MNGLPSAPATSLRITTTVVVSIAIGAGIGLSTLATCLIWNLKPDPVILTAFVSVTGQLIGSLTGLLMNTRTQPTPEKPSEPPKLP